MRSRFIASSGALVLERNNFPESGSCTPHASAQTSELHNLAVIDKKVGVRTLVLGYDTQRLRRVQETKVSQ
jgi:hypothetical protein